MEVTATKGNYVEWGIESMMKDDDNILRQMTHRWDFSIVSTILYIVLVFGGRKCMENRKKYNLRRPLMLWSTLLAAFSIIGTVRTWALGWEMYHDGGVKGLVCDSNFYRAPITHFWSILFLYSKFVEYGDTCFIILRKQTLIFLHWYHHVTVALFCWLTFRGEYAGGYIFMMLNYGVHSLMYTYYALKAAEVKVPRSISKVITTLQIIQMFLGCATVAGVWAWNSEEKCKATSEYVIAGGVMYASYLILFIQFFFGAYLSSGIKKKTKVKGEASLKSENEETSSTVTSDVRSNHAVRLRKRRSWQQNEKSR